MRLATTSVFIALALTSAACAPDKTPANLTKQSDLPAGAVVASANTVSLLVANKDNKPIEGIPVEFVVTAGGGNPGGKTDPHGAPGAAPPTPPTGAAGGGTLSATTDTTDAAGLASSTLTIGTVVGANTVSATVAALAPVSFSTTSVAGPATSVTLPSRITLLNVDGSSTLAPVAKDVY